MRGIRRWLAPLLTGVLLSTSAAVPLLDRDPGARTPAVETEHHPSTCHVGHDHRICTLVGASHWLDGDAGRHPAARPRPHRVRMSPVQRPVFSHTPSVHRSRAPPAV